MNKQEVCDYEEGQGKDAPRHSLFKICNENLIAETFNGIQGAVMRGYNERLVN